MTDSPLSPLTELQYFLIQLRLEGHSVKAIKSINPDMDVAGELESACRSWDVPTDFELSLLALGLGMVEGPLNYLPSLPLTPSEESLIPYLLQGYTDIEMERETHFSLSAVRGHFVHLKEKFGVSDKLALTARLYKYRNLHRS